MHVKGCSHFFVVVKITSAQTVHMYIHKDIDCTALLFVFINFQRARLSFACMAYQTKPTRPNLPDQIYQTKPSRPNLPNQTKPKLLVKAVNAWVHSAFDNIS